MCNGRTYHNYNVIYLKRYLYHVSRSGYITLNLSEKYDFTLGVCLIRGAGYSNPFWETLFHFQFYLCLKFALCCRFDVFSQILFCLLLFAVRYTTMCGFLLLYCKTFYTGNMRCQSLFLRTYVSVSCLQYTTDVVSRVVELSLGLISKFSGIRVFRDSTFVSVSPYTQNSTRTWINYFLLIYI